MKALGFIRYICTGTVPDTPDNVSTRFSDDNVVVSWNEPDDGGSQITSYRIVVRTNDKTTYITELSNCDGSYYGIVD